MDVDVQGTGFATLDFDPLGLDDAGLTQTAAGDATGMNSTGFAPWVEQGKLRLLGLFSDKRSPRWPEVPTLREQGYDVSLSNWRAIIGPKGLTAAQIGYWEGVLAKVAAALAAARGAFPGRRLVLAFQPHRFTRTRDCFGEFVQVLRSFDALVLTEVYPAGEAKIPSADGKSLMKAALAEEKSHDR